MHRTSILISRKEAKLLRRCLCCGDDTVGRRRSSVYCSDACKQKDYRLRQRAKHEAAELQSRNGQRYGSGPDLGAKRNEDEAHGAELFYAKWKSKQIHGPA